MDNNKNNGMPGSRELAAIWDTVLEEISHHLSISSMNLWFNELKLALLNDTTAVFVSPSDFKRDIVEKMHTKTLKEYILEVLGYDVDVVILSDEHGPVDLVPYVKRDELLRIADEPQAESEPKPTESAEPDYYGTTDGEALDPGRFRPNTAYTFDNFMVGSSNKFAHAAALAVANTVADEEDAGEYNPLFIYGASGLGKTHLLYAITNRVLELNPDAKIVYSKGDEFTNQMIRAISTNSTAEFREKFRQVDLLMIDDIQFIAGRDGTQEEFFNTFNALYDDGKQIVMTSDRPPREIKRLEDRLLTRFEWGVQADIQKPNYELRCAIARKKAQLMGLDCPDEVINMICENLTDNVRQIEGALKKVMMHSRLDDTPVTVETAREWLSDTFSTTRKKDITPDQVIRAVSQRYGISASDIRSRKRSADIANARHKCVYLINKLCGMKPSTIGDKVFNRDHTTMANSIRNVEFEIENDAAYEEDIRDLIEEINKE